MTPLGVDEAIEAAIRRHPWYANRTQVLHQWFCVFGNGMKWEAGAIVPKVSEERDETPEEWLRHIILDPYEGLKDALPDAYERQLREYEEQCVMLRDHRERAAELARTPGSLGRDEPYRYSKSVLLAQIPEDVRPDWAAAAQEITDYLNENYPGWNKD